jgi:protease-4
LTHFGQGPHDDATSLSRPWSAADHAAVQRTLSRYYGLFLDRTAHARKLDRAGLTDLAEGRIWYGDEAKDRGLIDRIGGMREAVDEAASRAHLDLDDDEVKFDYLPHPALFERIKSSLGLSVEAVAGQQAWLRALQTAAGPWLDAAAMAQLAQEPGPLAVLPAHAAVPGP